MRPGRAEYVADGAIHAAAILGAGLAGVTMIRLVPFAERPELAAAVLVYLATMLALAVASTLYNMIPGTTPHPFFQRLDHACIYLMIAGTYTPFCLFVIPAPWGVALLATVWSLAFVGAAARLAGWPLPDHVGTWLYLAKGWLVLLVLPPLLANLSGHGLVLLLTGGLLYTVGVAFYRWQTLPFRRAIWHGFVFGAATCHFFAVLHGVVLAQVAPA